MKQAEKNEEKEKTLKCIFQAISRYLTPKLFKTLFLEIVLYFWFPLRALLIFDSTP